MLASLTDYYVEVLKRLENIEEATKEMTFNLLEINDKNTLKKLAKMTDKELIKALSND